MKRKLKIILMALGLISGSSAASAQVYLATDKSCYVAGDVIWCSAFSASDNAVAYLELRSQDGMVQHGKISLDGGRGAGCMQIPLATPTGNYRLLAYTAAERAAGTVLEGAALISIFNTLSTERVKDGVDVLADEDYVASTGVVTASRGLDISEGKAGIRLTNTSGKAVSVCLSVFCDDGIAAPLEHVIEYSHYAAAKADQVEALLPCTEREGEIVRARLAGRDAALVATDPAVVAVASIPGLKTDVYADKPDEDGILEFRTGNVFGDRDITFMLLGMKDDMDCHVEPVSPLASVEVGPQRKLAMCRSMQTNLLRRTRAMKSDKKVAVDSLFTTLPTRKEHFFLERECTSFILDDYKRFPTMEEEFVEIFKGIRFRRNRDKDYVISVLLHDNVQGDIPIWGLSLIMIDGVPIFNHKTVMTYDPALVKRLDIYPYTYKLGDMSYGGVANFVTFKGNMPGVSFEDDVRIYDFKGAAYPMSYRGTETLLWEPLLSIAPGESLEFECQGQPGQRYNIVAEGISSDGQCVFARRCTNDEFR